MTRNDHKMTGFGLWACLLALAAVLLGASTASALDVDLSWQKSPAGENVLEYRIYSAVTSFDDTSKPGTHVVVDVDYHNSDLYALYPDVVAGTHMIYRLQLDDNAAGYNIGITAVAEDDEGNDLESVLSRPLVHTIKDDPDDQVAPGKPTLSAAALDANSIRLTYSAQDNKGVVGYDIYNARER